MLTRAWCAEHRVEGGKKGERANTTPDRCDAMRCAVCLRVDLAWRHYSGVRHQIARSI